MSPSPNASQAATRRDTRTAVHTEDAVEDANPSLATGATIETSAETPDSENIINSGRAIKKMRTRRGGLPSAPAPSINNLMVNNTDSSVQEELHTILQVDSEDAHGSDTVASQAVRDAALEMLIGKNKAAKATSAGFVMSTESNGSGSEPIGVATDKNNNSEFSNEVGTNFEDEDTDDSEPETEFGKAGDSSFYLDSDSEQEISEDDDDINNEYLEVDYDAIFNSDFSVSEDTPLPTVDNNTWDMKGAVYKGGELSVFEDIEAEDGQFHAEESDENAYEPKADSKYS